METSSQLEDVSAIAMEETESSISLLLGQEVLQITEPSITVVVPTLKDKVKLPDFLYKNRVILSRSKDRSKGRNDGALKCDSDFILFVDDDASFSEETYRKHIFDVLINNPDVVVSYKSNVILCTRVMGISRDLFFRIGGFDENFIVAEDQDFGYKALKNGYHISYIPRDLVHHREHPRLPQSVLSLMRYKKILLWDNKSKHNINVPFGLLNCLNMFCIAKICLSIPNPRHLVVSILSFYYYFFFDKTRLIENVS